MSCNSSDISIQNAFYLDSTLNQQQQYGSSDHQLSNGPNEGHGLGHQQHQQQNNLAFSNDSSNLYFTSSQLAQMQGTQNNNNNNNNMNNGGMNMNNLYNTNSNQLTSNSSHCTTPQTPSSIPDIILTGNFLTFLVITNLSYSTFNFFRTQPRRADAKYERLCKRPEQLDDQHQQHLLWLWHLLLGQWWHSPGHLWLLWPRQSAHPSGHWLEHWVTQHSWRKRIEWWSSINLLQSSSQTQQYKLPLPALPAFSLQTLLIRRLMIPTELLFAELLSLSQHEKTTHTNQKYLAPFSVILCPSSPVFSCLHIHHSPFHLATFSYFSRLYELLINNLSVNVLYCQTNSKHCYPLACFSLSYFLQLHPCAHQSFLTNSTNSAPSSSANAPTDVFISGFSISAKLYHNPTPSSRWRMDNCEFSSSSSQWIPLLFLSYGCFALFHSLLPQHLLSLCDYQPLSLSHHRLYKGTLTHTHFGTIPSSFALILFCIFFYTLYLYDIHTHTHTPLPPHPLTHHFSLSHTCCLSLSLSPSSLCYSHVRAFSDYFLLLSMFYKIVTTFYSLSLSFTLEFFWILKFFSILMYKISLFSFLLFSHSILCLPLSHTHTNSTQTHTHWLRWILSFLSISSSFYYYYSPTSFLFFSFHPLVLFS